MSDNLTLESAARRLGLNPDANIFNQYTKKLDDIIWDAAIYCRVSDPLRDETLQTQERYLRKYASINNYHIFDVYKDADSGSYSERPNYVRMLNDIKMGLVNLVLVRSQDRYARDLMEICRQIVCEFKLQGVRFIAMIENIDNFVTDESKIIMTALTSQEFLVTTSRKTREALKQIASDGYYIGSQAPYGYNKLKADAHNKLIRATDGSAETVERIFNMYIGGSSLGRIAQTLIEENVPPPRERWTPNTIRSILANEKYCGIMAQGKTAKEDYRKYSRQIKVEKDQWIIGNCLFEGIIPVDKFALAQDMMNRRAQNILRVKKEEHIFSGIFKCGDCGSTMYYRANGLGYKCGNSQVSSINRSAKCSTHFIKESYLVDKVCEDLKVLITKVDKEALTQKAIEYYSSLFCYIDSSIQYVSKEKESYEKRISQLYCDYESGIIPQLSYKIAAKELEQKYEKVLLEEQNLKYKKKENDESIELVKKIVDDVINMGSLDRQMAITLIKNMSINNDGSLNIAYNFQIPA